VIEYLFIYFQSKMSLIKCILFLSLVYVLLEEILTSSIQRCTDPQLMETRVRHFSTRTFSWAGSNVHIITNFMRYISALPKKWNAEFPQTFLKFKMREKILQISVVFFMNMSGKGIYSSE
jgi:hypothetical protein